MVDVVVLVCPMNVILNPSPLSVSQADHDTIASKQTARQDRPMRNIDRELKDAAWRAAAVGSFVSFHVSLNLLSSPELSYAKLDRTGSAKRENRGKYVQSLQVTFASCFAAVRQ